MARCPPCCKVKELVCDQKPGENRVIRGGSWNNKARNCRSAYRNRNEPDNRNDNLGFRCVRAHERVG
ncbi:MAG: hypothetical protein D3925_18915 [Candidatus Electrothrix sp. AR5]|nr:hypothetical protein [Candidatus Electrothrix sp. AR5]